METEREKLVAYKRTSTDDQRLGIEAQEETLRRIARDLKADVVRTFVEHESGGNSERPELDKAIRFARRTKASLCVAKLDRLARDTAFLLPLYDSGVKIIFGDMPHLDLSAASRMMIVNMSNFAEYERLVIGERTKAALGVLKARGVKLGTPANLDRADREKAAQLAGKNRTARAIEEMKYDAATATAMRSEGATLAAIAAALNADGGVTREGKTWSPTQVKRILDRAAGKVPCRRPRADVDG